jgi:hypothetical protein
MKEKFSGNLKRETTKTKAEMVKKEVIGNLTITNIKDN